MVWTPWMDRFGTAASAVCATHCLILATVPAVASLAGLGFLAHESLEWVFFASAAGLAAVAAVGGFLVHRSGWVLGGFAVGLGLLVAGRLGEALALYEGGAALAVMGGVALAGCHLLSTRQVRQCQGTCAESV